MKWKGLIPVILLVLALPMSSWTNARTWYVKSDGNGDAPTIQAAIDLASAMDTVLVAAGTYNQSAEVLIGGVPKIVNIHLNKNIYLLAEDSFHGAVIDYTGNDHAMVIENAQSPVVRGFNFYIPWAGCKSLDSYTIYCTSGCTIEFNLIKYNFCAGAIRIEGPSIEAKVVRNNLLLHNYAGVSVSAPNVTVEHNTIFSDTDVEFGVGVAFAATSSGLLVQNNILIWGSRAVGCNNCDMSAFAIHCNAIYETILDFAQQTAAIDLDPSNFELTPWGDPQFCGARAGNFYLQADSPCAPGNHPNGYDCGFIGAYPVNCGTTPAEEKTWGSIKDRYR